MARSCFGCAFARASARSATDCPASVVRRCPSRITAKTSSAYEAAPALSSAPENAATAPNQSAGSWLGGRPCARCAAARSAAPPATFAAASPRSLSAEMPVRDAALGSVSRRAGSVPVLDFVRCAVRPRGRLVSPRGSSAPSPCGCVTTPESAVRASVRCIGP
ncbi:hypothetical protein GA0115246_108885 [Streptomyces sp. SolWspMP-sol7th]|nr:hypothetical protein GA0115246_108885 [Streptomyces sp. SolWspMP-sol7th]